MGEKTGIEWTDHTFNPWIGCTRISDACGNCYAATMSHRRKWDVPFHFKQWGEWHGHSPDEKTQGGARHTWNDGHVSIRIGKKAAGAILDGRAWRQFPM